jgi:hypothetical protein
MGDCPLCTSVQTTAAGAVQRQVGRLRRAWRSLSWLMPAMLLACMPKCPLCVAAYIALFTGIGVSVATAHWIRIILITSCVAVLLALVLKAWWRRVMTVRACDPGG